MGGVALVQSPETAQFTSMPSSAIPSGLVDEILSPEDLAQTVFEILRFSDNCPSAKPEEASLIDPNQLQQILDILAVYGAVVDVTHRKTIEAELVQQNQALEDAIAIAQAVEDTFATAATEKGLAFRVTIQPDIPRQLRGDDLRLQQILNNLVGNGIKFTATGEVRLTISRDSNTASDHPEASGLQLRFQVHDTGIGIQPEYQEKLFQPFTQGDGSTL